MKNLEQKAMAYEMYSQQLQAIQNEIASIRALKNEINKTIETIENIKLDEETLIPVGPGVFLKAKIIEDKALLGIKSDLFIEKPFNETIEKLKNKLDELDKVEKEGIKRIEELSKIILELRKELEEAMKKEKEKKEQ
ncbi:prefoldin subunit alpha [Methanocaldococcus villosus KIN24-T80]|uniref:Prefoldin subunit alpha n=1 Tax=Methanocaldococcus villosus KIN24-T80 TaxID=1069083 RepID=N6V2Y8_9EURY|nr:prefoldin subunit alpha [Methanocaldococcus villosus]ENN96598.1 prefoldin subunit alpha [Methanocaldococcus villosus KIN24-T80]